MGIDYRQKAREWYTRAIKETDEFVKFILLYISLEVSIKQNFSNIRSIKQDQNIRSYFLNKFDKSELERLKVILDKEPLINMNPDGDNRWSGKLDNTIDFDGVIEFIIRARNNLFHGDKSMGDERDIFIVKWGSQIIQPLLDSVLQD